MTVWYLHGVNNSERSFAWLIDNLPPHDHRPLHYNPDTPIWQTVERLALQMNGMPGYIVGHSLGGLIAVILSHLVETKGVVTLAAPFGGSEIASWLTWLAGSETLRALNPRGSFIRAMQCGPVPTLSLVARTNAALYGRQSDGMVTVASQTAISGPRYIEIDASHSEILLSLDALNHIKDTCFEIPSHD